MISMLCCRNALMIKWIIESGSAILTPWRRSLPNPQLPGPLRPAGSPSPAGFPGPGRKSCFASVVRRSLRSPDSVAGAIAPTLTPAATSPETATPSSPATAAAVGVVEKAAGQGSRMAPAYPSITAHPAFTGKNSLVTLCSACHARVHRRLRQRSWLPETLLEFWCEQHPGLPLQLQFTLSPSGDCWEIAV